MASLYELQGEYYDLLDLLSDPESDQDSIQAALSGLSQNIKNKAEGYVKVYMNLQADVNALDEEAKRLQERKKKAKERMDSLKESILQSMLTVGVDKIKTPLFTVKTAKAIPALIVDDEDEIPEEFYVLEPKLDKKKAKEWITQNGECEWGHLERKDYLRIS